MKTYHHKRFGKKGSFLGIGEFFSGFFSGLGSVIQLIPKPIKFILFFCLIILFGNLIQLLLGTFGVFCDSANIPHSVPFPNNFLLLNDLLSFDNNSVVPEDCYVRANYGLIIGDGSTLSLPDGIITGDGYVASINGSRYFYKSACADCERGEKVRVLSTPNYVSSSVNISSLQNYLFYADDFCLLNANRSSVKFECIINFGDCNVPAGKYYDHLSNQYLFINQTSLSSYQKAVADKWDANILKKGGKPLYPAGFVSGDISDTTIIGIKCVDARPKIALFRQIEIFDYKLWVMILLLIFVFILYKVIKG